MITKKQEDEFNRIVDILVRQGDVNCLCDMIPDEVKKRFIVEWKEGSDDN